MSIRDNNKIVFEDTRELCTTHPMLVESIREGIKNQKLILESESVMGEQNPAQGVSDTEPSGKEKEKKTRVPARIIVSSKRTLEAAAEYKGKKICVLNFASATNPGGGVVQGASAQEECLCRCSTLYFNLNIRELMTGFYYPHRNANDPLYNNDCIYTPDVMVFKRDTQDPELMGKEEWYKVNVITCAAPNLREMPSNMMNPFSGDKPVGITADALKKLHRKRGRRIFDIAKANGSQVLILGAFGCGAFRNPAKLVAEVYAELVQEYQYDFETIEFAVYCSSRDSGNFDAFKAII
ncbi:MAG: TIGR02452 family protein [Clostridia bacterium]|nr:TIGR02452 family protein [Clostridia bacterium]NCC44627.1 TIGR02452 family protein [Clostridia bacterium]